MCNGQSHFHINSLHPEGKSSPSSWIKGLLYCIWLPVSLFSHRVLFFLTLSTWTKAVGSSQLQTWHCCEWQAWGDSCWPSWWLQASWRRWEDMHEVKAHALDIMCTQMGGEMWNPLLYCQQRCLNLIKCLNTFLWFNSQRCLMVAAEQLRLAWPWSFQNMPFLESPGLVCSFDGVLISSIPVGC